jgi:hypothetical protein
MTNGIGAGNILHRLPDDPAARRAVLQARLQLREGDALWMLLDALEFYEQLYQRHPARIRAETELQLAHFTRAAEAEARRLQAKSQQALVETVAQAGIATAATMAARARWSAGALLAALMLGLCSAAAGAMMMRAHLQEQARAVADWSQTPQARQAYALAQGGDIALLAECAAPGWQMTFQNGALVCFPYPTRDGQLHGWVLEAAPAP